MPDGRVFLVGAGPGDPELLTLKAARLIASAQVLVHDRLVHPGVLALAPVGAERIPVSKQAGGPTTSQADIHRILIDRARRGLRVLRIKGGDPFLLGRGAEEVLALSAAGIACEVVPGLTSALVAPVVAAVPLTHRGVASTVVIASAHVTGPREVDWGGFARIDGTVVLLMGMHQIDHMAQQLIQAGKDPLTPSVAVQWATWEHERVVRAALRDLAPACRLAAMGSPGVVVIGEVVDVLRGILDTQAGRSSATS